MSPADCTAAPEAHTVQVEAPAGWPEAVAGEGQEREATLAELVANMSKAYEDWSAKNRIAGRMLHSTADTPEESAAVDACDMHSAAWAAILNYTPKSIFELERKIVALSSSEADGLCDQQCDRLIKQLGDDTVALRLLPQRAATPLPELRARAEEINAKLDRSSDDMDHPFDTEEEREAAFNAAEAEWTVAVDDLCGYEPADLHDWLAKFRALTTSPLYPTDDLPAHLIAYLVEDIERIANGPSLTAHQRRWEDARSRCVHADGVHKGRGRRLDETKDLVEALAPIPEALITERVILPWTGRASTRYYHCEGSINQEQSLSVERKAELLAVFREWRPRRDAAEAQHAPWPIKAAPESEDSWHSDSPSDAWLNEALDDMDQADSALINTPASSVEALAFKLRRIIERGWTPRYGQSPDDVATIANLLAVESYDKAWPIVRVYQDALRLAGEPSPILEVEPFRAEDWIDAFAKVGGSFTVDREFRVSLVINHLEEGSHGALQMWSALQGLRRGAVIAELQSFKNAT